MFCLIGCGSLRRGESDRTAPDTSQPSPDTIQSKAPKPQAVKLADNIPYPCDATVHGNMVFLKGSGFHVCTNGNAWEPIDLKGDAGMQGPPGLAGPKGGSALVAVYDAQDRMIGWVLDMSGLFSLHRFRVLLTAGGIVELFPNGYIPSVSIEGVCHYSSADCSGICRMNRPNALSRVTNQYTNSNPDLPKAYVLSSSNDMGEFNYLSYFVPGNNCSSAAGTMQSSFAVVPLKLISGATYPFGPISLRAE